MILIIDDDAALASGLRRFFCLWGLNAVSAVCGAHAFALLEQWIPQLIVLDLNMPEMDGMAVLRRLRRNPRFRDVSIVIHSSEFSPEIKSQALAAGAQAFITKGSLGLDGFLTRIRRLLASDGARAA